MALVVTIMICSGLAAPNLVVFAQQYNTFYSPEKRFSIDYLTPLQFNITDTENKTKIVTDYIITIINIKPDPKTMDLDERAVFMQKHFQNNGYGLIQTTQPIIVDDRIGYVFIISNDDHFTSSWVYVTHNDKIYSFQIYYNLGFGMDYGHHIDHIVNSIKFFG
jgi:hypothetical protein